MNFTFQGFAAAEYWKREETKDNKYTMTLAPNIVIPIPDFHQTVPVSNYILSYDHVIPTCRHLDGDYVFMCYLPSGRWAQIPKQTDHGTYWDFGPNLREVLSFVEHILCICTIYETRMDAIEKRVDKHQSNFEQIAERSDVFAAFVKEGEAIVKAETFCSDASKL